MTNTLRILGSVCILLTLGLFVGCSDDGTTPSQPQPDPEPMAGSIGIYANAGGTNSKIADTGNLVTVYVVHNVTNGATAAQFRVEAPNGWTLQAAQSQLGVSIGDVTTGVSQGFGSCQSGAVNLMTLTYQSPGTSTGSFRVLPHTDAPDAIQVVDCNQNLLNDANGEVTPVN